MKGISRVRFTKHTCKEVIMTKKLKIAIPPIRCYQHYAFPVSIINSNIQQKEYLYSLFIKLVYRRNRDTDIEFDTPRFFSHIPTFFAEKGLIIPSVTKYHLNADDKESMISFVKQLINNGIYVSGMWNENYIPGKDAYNKYNYKRNYLIYGYDEEKRCLISAGYLGKNFWSNEFNVDYCDFAASLYEREKTICFFTYIYNDAFNSTLDLKEIKKDVMDYLNSTILIKNQKECSFGLNANKDFFENLQRKVEKKGDLTFPPLYALYEHKNFMLERLAFLKKLDAIKISEKDMRLYKEVVDVYRAILYMGVKYKMTREKESIKKISKMGHETIEIEQDILGNTFSNMV